MNEKQLLEQIRALITQIEGFDISRLYPKGQNVSPWHNMSNDGLKIFTDRIIDTLKQIKNPINESAVLAIGFDKLNNIYNHLQNFINSFSQVSTLLDHGISTQHHSPLEYLNSINDITRSSGLYADLKFDKEGVITNLEKAVNLAKDILANEDSYKTSIEVFKEARKEKDEFVKSLISEKGKLFSDTAERYRAVAWKKSKLFKTKFDYLNNFYYPTGSFWQLILSLIFGALILFIVYDFIIALKNEPTIGLGAATLRVSALIVPSYFAIYFARRYTIGLRLYEFYSLKAMSLATMADLFTTYPTFQEKILEKATTIIFSEFNEKSDGDLTQKDVMNFALDVAKMNK